MTGAASAEPRAKSALRAQLRASRQARTPAQRDQVARDLALAAGACADLAALGPGDVVAAYASTATEPGTGPLRALLARWGVTVLVPVVGPEPGPLGWVRVGPRGLGQPQVASPGQPAGVETAGAEEDGLAEAAVVLVPALAVDRAGTRLGQGGGHYDRTLARVPAGPSVRRPLLVAVVHAEEVLPAGALPREPHDVPVDVALTPDGWVRLDGRRADADR